ncbi:hypothetical protein ACEQ8H_001459 [Pleosporales sp. CAS-2024a]
MARATRSKPKAKEPTPESPVSTVKALPASTSNPPKLFVLPKDASPDARIVTLDNPANGSPSRYYFCPNKGFYEFTRITAPKKQCRSWLITGSQKDDEAEETHGKEGRIGSGYINESADMFIATPIDLLFLILPALAPKSAKETKQHFLAFDDYLDKLLASSRHWRVLLAQHASLKTMIQARMRLICDTVDASDETMYRLSSPKLLAILLKKAERMVSHGLPASLEERFIKTALQVPMMSLQREESSFSGTTATCDAPSSSTESQSSTTDTTMTTPDDDDNASKPTPPAEALPPTPCPLTLTAPPDVPHLLRIRTALTYLMSSYLPATLHSIPLTHLSSPLFAPLTTHLAAIASLKAEAAALRSISDNITRKRAMDDDDDAAAGREEKKRKKEEEEKKKKLEGRAVKQLKKVDTSGMKKMSAFFKKVEKKV